ncbi:MAG: lipopolysaccharide biosynthesis protein [Gammaproteobacteria bacterium]|nr:lipopolysaccharide biosynthesis protein [Gammaproteobacteria bacterium]
MEKLVSWFRTLFSNSFVRNVALVTSGTVLGQAIVVAISPILSRIYAPEDFGAFAVFASTVGILAIVASMRYEIAIPLPAEDADAWALAKLALLGALVVGVVLLLSSGFWTGPFAQKMGLSTGQSKVVYLIPFGIVVTTSFQIMNYLVIRNSRHHVLAKSKVVQGFISASAQTGLGVVGAGAPGLALGLIAGRFGSALYSYFSLNARSIELPSLFQVAKKYSRFPKLALLSGGINALAVEMPMLLTSAIFGTGVAGLYSLAQRVVAAPMSMVGNSIAQVYMAKLGEYVRNENTEAITLYVGIAKKLFKASIVPFALLALVSPYVFGLLFGPSWQTAGEIVRVLTPAFFARFVVVPLSQTLNYIGRQDYQLAWDLFRFIGIAIIYWVAKVARVEYLIVFTAYSIFLTFAYVILYAITTNMLRLTVRNWRKDFEDGCKEC